MKVFGLEPLDEWSVKMAMVKKLWIILDDKGCQLYLNREMARDAKHPEALLLPVQLTSGQQKVVNNWLNTSSR